MGFQVGPTSHQGTRSTMTTLSEINVTPLVDVMLVLLIVFMVSAPLMQQGVQVDLPKANASNMSETPDQVVLIIRKDGQILLNDKPIPPGSLRARLEAISAAKPSTEVFIRADKDIPYGTVAAAMAEVKQAKIQRVGLVTEPGDSKSKL